jgi:hypothetical protein
LKKSIKKYLFTAHGIRAYDYITGSQEPATANRGNTMNTAIITNDIDAMVALDKQIKELEKKLVAAKADIANKYGEGEHRGNTYGVLVTLSQRSTVGWKKLADEAKIPMDMIAKYTKTSAIITVTSKA